MRLSPRQRDQAGVQGTARPAHRRRRRAKLAMLERLAERMSKEEKSTISRQLKHGFIYLSPLLFKPMNDFWKLPDDFSEYDQKLEELAAKVAPSAPRS